jgi:hypothetical protein
MVGIDARPSRFSVHDTLLLRVSPLTPDPLHVSNNITTNITDSSFLFVQLYNEYGTAGLITLYRHWVEVKVLLTGPAVTQIPVFGDDGGLFTVQGSGQFGAASAVGVAANDVRPAVTHFLLPGNSQAMSVRVSRVDSSQVVLNPSALLNQVCNVDDLTSRAAGASERSHV